MTDAAPALACVEVGGSGHQTVVFSAGSWQISPGAHCPAGADLAMAVPGIISEGRVVAASNLGWFDVDPADALALPGPAQVVMNDAEAAALGEAVLRAPAGEPVPDLVFVGLGTGVGGAVVDGAEVRAANLFGHARGFSNLQCRCGQIGCLETVVSGWALPFRLAPEVLTAAGAAIASAIEHEPLATPRRVVVAGGLAASNPGLLDAIRGALPSRIVEATAAPRDAKSASAWGLRHAVQRLPHVQPR